MKPCESKKMKILSKSKKDNFEIKIVEVEFKRKLDNYCYETCLDTNSKENYKFCHVVKNTDLVPKLKVFFNNTPKL